MCVVWWIFMVLMRNFWRICFIWCWKLIVSWLFVFELKIEMIVGFRMRWSLVILRFFINFFLWFLIFFGIEVWRIFFIRGFWVLILDMWFGRFYFLVFLVLIFLVIWMLVYLLWWVVWSIFWVGFLLGVVILSLVGGRWLGWCGIFWRFSRCRYLWSFIWIGFLWVMWMSFWFLCLFLIKRVFGCFWLVLVFVLNFFKRRKKRVMVRWFSLMG